MEKANVLLYASLARVKAYCERQHFKGWDPYDGLNSRVFHAIPFAHRSAFLRLCVIQGFKRCPVNLRPLLLVPKVYNAKAIALFLQGYCNLYKSVTKNGNLADKLGTAGQLLDQVNALAKLLISLRSPGDYHGACWGYSFEWQARTGLDFPKHTPTVVVTNFAATALMEAYEITHEQQYLDVALSAGEFVMHDLHRMPYKDGFLFSYSPLKGNDTVFNASLLGSRLLSYCYRYNGNEQYRQAAEASVRACCAGQREDGAWIYGMESVQTWVDSFHTGYDLDGLVAYEELTGDTKYHAYLEKGFNYYVSRFFEDDGCPKYYDNRKYPIDIHCPGQLFVTLSRMHRFEQYQDLASKVLAWTVSNMQSPRGYFYYQLKKGINTRIPYMRWSNAFMFYALSYYLIFTER